MRMYVAMCSMQNPGVVAKYEMYAARELKARAVRDGKERAAAGNAAQGERMRDVMATATPVPIRIKLISQLDGGFLEGAARERLEKQLAPGAVRIIEKFVQVCGTRSSSSQAASLTPAPSTAVFVATAAAVRQNNASMICMPLRPPLLL